MIQKVNSIIISAVFVLTTSSAYSSQVPDLENEIIRIKKEIASVSSQRKAIALETVNDSKEHDSYKKRMNEKLKEVNQEIDSLGKIETEYRKKNDSLAIVITSLKSNQKEYELLNNNFRSILTNLCDKIIDQVQKTPPMVSKDLSTPLSFLKSELMSGNIDNTEGMQRLFQIIKNYEEATSTIQIYQGTSPTPQLQGTIFGLRIGCLFEAAVQSDATRYAVWNFSYSTGKGTWSVYNDSRGASEILSAIYVREGKSLPAFARIPSFGTVEGN